MGVRLTVKLKTPGGDEQPRTVVLDEDEITLGRDQSCQVVLAKMGVSRRHARILRDETLYFVEDLESTYGTHVNGQKLPKKEKRLLKNGDVIAIANFDVRFDRVADQVENEPAGKTMFVSRNLVKGVMQGLGTANKGALFRVMNGPLDGTKVELADAKEYVFGRDEEAADIVLKDDLVSRRHAKVRRDLMGTHLEDLGSRNGIKVNKKKVRRVTLKDGDEVEIGGVRLLYIDPNEVREDPVVIGDDFGVEHTVAVLDPPRQPEKPKPEPKPEPKPSPPPPEPPPPEPPPPQEPEGATEEAPLDEPRSEVDNAVEDVADQPDEDATGAGEEGPYEDEGPVEEEGPRKLIDFSNKTTVIALAVGAVMVIFGVVVLVLLLATG